MPIYGQIALGAALTLAGLVASWLTGRRRGAAAGLRGAAWSLLPLAAALVGAVDLLWRFGTAIADFAGSFVFAPRVWGGVIVAGVAAGLFAISGGLRRRRRAAKAAAGRDSGAAVGRDSGAAVGQGSGAAVGQGSSGPASIGAGGTGASGAPAGKAGKRAAKADDDELGDVADILRRHGIR